MALQNPQAIFHLFGEDTVGNVALTVIISQTRIAAASGGGSSDKGNETQIRDIVVSADRASQNTKVILEIADDNGSGAPSTFKKKATIRVPDYGNAMRSYTGQIKIKAGQWYRVRYQQGTIGAVEVEVTGDAAVNDTDASYLNGVIQ